MAKKKRSRANVRYSPSRPGEYPHMDTGHLRRSIYRSNVERVGNELIVRVGTKVFYGKILELTQKSNGRPFLRRTLAEERRRINGILAGTASASVKHE